MIPIAAVTQHDFCVVQIGDSFLVVHEQGIYHKIMITTHFLSVDRGQ